MELPKDYIWAGTFKEHKGTFKDIVNFFKIDMSRVMKNKNEIVIEELNYIGKEYFALYISKRFLRKIKKDRC